jgi:hypothetical protein
MLTELSSLNINFYQITPPAAAAVVHRNDTDARGIALRKFSVAGCCFIANEAEAAATSPVSVIDHENYPREPLFSCVFLRSEINVA